MAILLLRLAGPMQSWGTQSRFSHRDSDLEPSKSGVVGLLCASMGIPRHDMDEIARLAELKMGVRVDRQGTLKRDYHTALDVIKASGAPAKRGEAVISQRYYLADACFLVALLGELVLLREILDALAKPVWQLFLGRKAFVPDPPVFLPDGLLTECDDLAEGLGSYPYLIPDEKELPERLRLELETEFGEGERVKQDQPVSFVSASRRFNLRHVRGGEVVLNNLPPAKEGSCISLV